MREQILEPERRLLEAERRELEAKQRAFELEKKCFELEQEVRRLQARVEELEQGRDAKKPPRHQPAPPRGPEHERLALAIIDLLEEHRTWKGTMSDLLAILKPKGEGDPQWPTTPHKLTRCVRKAESLLKAKGVSVLEQARTNRGPVFLITSSTEVSGTGDETLARES